MNAESPFANSLILGIETSCDETSVALVRGGRRVVRQAIASQIGLHERFGGVVPEVASRAHLRLLLPLIERVLREAEVQPKAISAIAVTAGPGLVGALLVGVETAKTLAYLWGCPLLAVHHVAGHLLSPFLESAGATLKLAVPQEGQAREDEDPSSADLVMPPEFPYIGLVVSGGHTSLVRVDSPVSYTLLGDTVDDAAGECLDKVAKALGLGFPGGPALAAAAARSRQPQAYSLPRPMLNSGDDRFSFSGLKTAALQVIQQHGGMEAGRASAAAEPDGWTADLCAALQDAVAEVLVTKARRALEREGLATLAVVGGVASNAHLRSKLAERLAQTRVVIPPPVLCTDNAAMIACVGHFLLQEQGLAAAQGLDLNARAEWPIYLTAQRA